MKSTSVIVSGSCPFCDLSWWREYDNVKPGDIPLLTNCPRCWIPLDREPTEQEKEAAQKRMEQKKNIDQLLEDINVRQREAVKNCAPENIRDEILKHWAMGRFLLSSSAMYDE